MSSLVVTVENTTVLEGGKVGYGSTNFSCRGGSYQTYAVRLSAKAASLVELGDTIEYWRGKTDWCTVECSGQIIKANGKKIQLYGYADNGIDTGHSPHLGLKMIQAPKLAWEPESSLSINVIQFHGTGEVFLSEGRCFPSSIEHARSSYKTFVAPIELAANQKAELTLYGNPMYGFQSGWWRLLKKVVRMRDTDKVLVL